VQTEENARKLVAEARTIKTARPLLFCPNVFDTTEPTLCKFVSLETSSVACCPVFVMSVFSHATSSAESAPALSVRAVVALRKSLREELQGF
jgi:hypothetical protein